MASGTETSQLPRLPYGEQDDDASARHMASVTILSRLRSRPSFWLSSGDLYGWGMMFSLFPVSLYLENHLPIAWTIYFDKFSYNSF